MTKKERLQHVTELLEKGLKFLEIKEEKTVKTWGLSDPTLSKYIAECNPVIKGGEDEPKVSEKKTPKEPEQKNKPATIEACKITAELLEKQLSDVINTFRESGVGITALKAARAETKNVAKILHRYA